MTKAPRIIGAAMAAAVLVVLSAMLALPADAHTAMLRASPDRNATAGGSLTFIDLEFLDPITEATVTVAYNGAPMAGVTTVNAGEVITFTLDQALAQPGRYQVTYEMVSFDGDFTTGGYFFTFDPTAAPMTRITVSEFGESGEPGEPDGVSSTTIAVTGIGLVVIVAVLALFAWWMDRRRGDELVPAGQGRDRTGASGHRP